MITPESPAWPFAIIFTRKAGGDCFPYGNVPLTIKFRSKAGLFPRSLPKIEEVVVELKRSSPFKNLGIFAGYSQIRMSTE